ncbi:MAG: hypothetical protein GC200_11490 [Tepidisphaera sp.]|nr:hypothetical protein [Tepidisphaera sp.]
MALAITFLGLVLAVGILIVSMRAAGPLRAAGALLAIVVFLVGFVFGSVTNVGANQVGIVTRNAIGGNLAGGKIIATDGEKGVQAEVLAPGLHFGYWPVLYTVKTVPLVEVQSDELGLVETADGLPLPAGQLFAPDWAPDQVQQMLDAKYFLTAGKGYKGKQATVLPPGKYRLNTELYRVKMTKQTEVAPGEVAVLKANYGEAPTIAVKGEMGALVEGKVDAGTDGSQLRLAGEREMGVRAKVLPPGKYPLNTDAYSVTEIWTTQMIAHYTASAATNPAYSEGADQRNPKGGGVVAAHDPMTEERGITVRTSDGFTFPVDVRVEYVIEPEHAPIVAAKLGDDEGPRFRNALNSAVRAIFRNHAENVKALDYVQQRSQQETQSLESLAKQMARFGVTVTAVRIGNVGDEETLGALLKTQTDREIAKQEQLTFQEQQRAAEQKKQLARTTQESDEEKKLATATYSVKIASEAQKQKIVEANAEAQAIAIKAEAQAKAYEQIANQIGKSNAAAIEMLKIVGERNIQITPRILMTGGTGGAHNADAGNLLMSTMLDNMMGKDEGPGASQTPVMKPAQPPAATGQ